jgi:hypothetical protein
MTNSAPAGFDDFAFGDESDSSGSSAMSQSTTKSASTKTVTSTLQDDTWNF